MGGGAGVDLVHSDGVFGGSAWIGLGGEPGNMNQIQASRQLQLKMWSHQEALKKGQSEPSVRKMTPSPETASACFRSCFISACVRVRPLSICKVLSNS